MYSEQARKAVRSIPIPVDFMMDIIEYPTNPPFIGLRFYESQWSYFSDNERLKCLQYMETIKKILQSYGNMVALDPVIDVTKIPKGEFYKDKER